MRDLLDALASESPVPAGGAAAALAGALGAAVAAMVCRIAALADPGRPPLRRLLSDADRLRRRLARLAAADAMAYARVVAAQRRRPRSPQSVDRALVAATEIPLSVAESARAVLALCRALVARARPSTLSDLGVAGQLAWAALESGALTTRTNLASLTPSPIARTLARRLALCTRESADLRREFHAHLEGRMASPSR
jgi:formiminotetrahydrofolate cyclodeaminase